MTSKTLPTTDPMTSPRDECSQVLLREALTPCRAVWSPDSPLSMNLPRDECCRGLPGDALCVPCNADSLSLSANSHRTVYQAGNETLFHLLLPRDECCRGLPEDAHSILCNAGPLSLSAHPQISTSQTADTTMPSSSCAHSPLFATASPISHTLTRHPNRDSDKLALMNSPREERCWGLPGNALCVPCNADSLSLSATSLRIVPQLGPETMSVLSMPRDECCRGLPGDALSILCNAGPLSLSAYPQNFTPQITDTAPPSSIHTQPHLSPTTSPTPLTTSYPLSPDGPPLLHPTKDNSCISWNDVPSLPLVSQQRDYPMPTYNVLPSTFHSLSFLPPTVGPMISPPLLSTSPIVLLLPLHRCLVSPCRAVWSPDSLPPMTLPRDECCRGLPGDALCVPCNADPLSLSATLHKTAYQTGNENVFPLLMPRDECCRGLPGGALSTLCNAGPLSFSTYPQNSTSQTAATAMPSSSALSSMTLSTPLPLPTADSTSSSPKSSMSSPLSRYSNGVADNLTTMCE
jgi:hypothetical protein